MAGPMSGFTIGRLAEATTTKVQTIRYYESIGLLPPFTRTEGGHRLYDREDRKRLTFIRHARDLERDEFKASRIGIPKSG